MKKFVKNLIKIRDEKRAMGMTREEAEEIANGIIAKLPRRARRSAARKIKNQQKKY